MPIDVKQHHQETELLRGPFAVPAGFSALTEPVWRASTITFPNVDAFVARRDQFLDGYTYGLAGTPTHYALSCRIAALERASYAVLAPSGLSAINLVNQSLLSAGDHVLLSDSVYGPSRSNAKALLSRWGVDVEFYDPLVASRIAELLRPNTRLVWCESPGSLTLEVQDVPAIVAACRPLGVRVALDNTWASPLGFRAMDHEVDLSIQALTKYVGGHSDLLLGSVSTNDRCLYEQLRRTANLLGANVSADDCALAIRGMATLPLRMREQSKAAREVARWLRANPNVSWLAFPPLEDDPGHALWSRDFHDCGTVMSFALASRDWNDVRRLADSLRVFQIGASFGGVHSLIAAYRNVGERDHPRFNELGPLLRLSIGLEHVEDLIADLSSAFASLPATRGGRGIACF